MYPLSAEFLSYFLLSCFEHGCSGRSRQMDRMEGVEEARNDNKDGINSQAPDSGQASYAQSYTQATVPNGHGAEQVSIRAVQQVIERPEVQNETHVGLGDDRGHLSISNVPGGVQVAVVPSTDDVGVVDGSLTSAASGVDRTDEGTHVVTAMPADYGLPGPPQYLIQHDDHEGKGHFHVLSCNYSRDKLVNLSLIMIQSGKLVDCSTLLFINICQFQPYCVYFVKLHIGTKGSTAKKSVTSLNDFQSCTAVAPRTIFSLYTRIHSFV